MQRLARDAAKVAELQEEVTPTWVVIVMAEAHTAWAGKMA
jgi:hypothetical protein